MSRPRSYSPGVHERAVEIAAQRRAAREAEQKSIRRAEGIKTHGAKKWAKIEADDDAREHYIAAIVAAAPPITDLSAEQIAAVRRLFRDRQPSPEELAEEERCLGLAQAELIEESISTRLARYATEGAQT